MHPILRHLGGAAGHLLLLSGFALFAVWYAMDAWSAQSEIENMLLIAPVAIVILTIMAGIAVRQIYLIWLGKKDAPIEDEGVEDLAPDTGVSAVSPSFRERYGAPLSAVGLGLYVIAMPVIGFDIATVIFVAGNMLLQGERRVFLIAAFSLLVAILPILGIEAMLSVPVPTTVLP